MNIITNLLDSLRDLITTWGEAIVAELQDLAKEYEEVNDDIKEK